MVTSAPPSSSTNRQTGCCNPTRVSRQPSSSASEERGASHMASAARAERVATGDRVLVAKHALVDKHDAHETAAAASMKKRDIF